MATTIEVWKGPEAMDAAAAMHVATAGRAAVLQRDRFTIALSGGRTPQGLYRLLATPQWRDEVPWARTHVFWADERWVPHDSPQSNYRMASELLLQHVDVPPQQIHPVPYGPSPESAAEAYSGELASVLDGAGLDLLVLGMGADGHTASLFPGSDALYSERRGALACYVRQVDAWRVTLTMPEINHGGSAVVLVSGREKAGALADVRTGHSQLPAARVAPGGEPARWITESVSAAAARELVEAVGGESASDASVAKRHAAEAAAETVVDGMVVGLGTGSTASLFVQSLGKRIKSGDVTAIAGVATSEVTARLAAAEGIALIEPDAGAEPDLTVDGADEVSAELDLVKGRGGALVREKIVACASRRLIAIADDSKLVERLGSQCAVPIAVVPFGRSYHTAAVAELGGVAELRTGPSGEAYVTDDGLWILDASFAGGIDHPQDLDAALSAIPGVAASGIFAGMTREAFIGDREGVWLYRR